MKSVSQYQTATLCRMSPKTFRKLIAFVWAGEYYCRYYFLVGTREKTVHVVLFQYYNHIHYIGKKWRHIQADFGVCDLLVVWSFVSSVSADQIYTIFWNCYTYLSGNETKKCTMYRLLIINCNMIEKIKHDDCNVHLNF